MRRVLARAMMFGGGTRAVVGSLAEKDVEIKRLLRSDNALVSKTVSEVKLLGYISYIFALLGRQGSGVEVRMAALLLNDILILVSLIRLPRH
jgi:hypothetical protein